MFGPWLFQACSMKHTDLGVKQGRAEAYSILGILYRIFGRSQGKKNF